MMSGSSSRTKINQRLAQLFAHDYLNRPTIQQRAFGYGKKRHVVHALGSAGAKWLTAHDGVEFPKGKGWHTANKLKSAERLEHQIGVVDTILRLENDTRRSKGLSVVHQDELLATADWPGALRPFRLPTQVRQQGAIVDRATDPDYTFVLSRRSDGKTQRSLCFLEWDNSTEDFIKANRLASSIAQKHRCYSDAYQRNLHTDLYGFKKFRVLFVVNGDDRRITKMRQVCDKVVENVPKDLFWYATVDALEVQGPLSNIWVTGQGQTMPLT